MLPDCSLWCQEGPADTLETPADGDFRDRTTFAPALAGLLAGPASRSRARRGPARPSAARSPTRVYLQVGRHAGAAAEGAGQQLRASTVNPITIIYKTTGSCTNIDAMYNGTKLTTNPDLRPLAGPRIPGWDPSQALAPVHHRSGGRRARPRQLQRLRQRLHAAVDARGDRRVPGRRCSPTCSSSPRPARQTAITAESAYFVFGFGAAGQVTPWIDETFMFIRAVDQEHAALDGRGHPRAGGTSGRACSSSSPPRSNAVATSTSPEKTIGILGAEIYDQNRTPRQRRSPTAPSSRTTPISPTPRRRPPTSRTCATATT